MGANAQLLFESVKAFHSNGWNSLTYVFSTNWCLFLLIAACITTVILSVKEQSNAMEVHPGQEFLIPTAVIPGHPVRLHQGHQIQIHRAVGAIGHKVRVRRNQQAAVQDGVIRIVKAIRVLHLYQIVQVCRQDKVLLLE